MKKVEICLYNSVTNIGIYGVQKYIQYLGYSKNMHFASTEVQLYRVFLDLLRKTDLKKIINASYKFCKQGYLNFLKTEELSFRMLRHKQFLPVRGQRTKTNAKTQKRKNKNKRVDKGRTFVKKKKK
jgi:ribosomal protein S13